MRMACKNSFTTLSFNFSSLPWLTLALPPFYCCGSKSPECNWNKTLSGLICLFSFQSFFFFLPLCRFDNFLMFGCGPLLSLLALWMSPGKVVWSPFLSRLSTRSLHISPLSLIKKKRSWNFTGTHLLLPPPTAGSHIPMETGEEEKETKGEGGVGGGGHKSMIFVEWTVAE